MCFMLLGRLCTSSEARHVGLTASCWDAHAYNHQQWENQGMFKKQAPKCLCSLLSTLLIPPFARIKGSWKQPKPSSISSSTQQKLSELPCSMEKLTTPTSEDRWHSRLETLKCALKHSAGVVTCALFCLSDFSGDYIGISYKSNMGTPTSGIFDPIAYPRFWVLQLVF